MIISNESWRSLTFGFYFNILFSFNKICRMFQIKAKLPRDGKLSVKVFDHDLIGANDLIGSTDIDIEDRFLSWRRASCGLSQQYIK